MRNKTTYIKICNVFMNDKIISENVFEVNENLSDEIILKFFALISSILDLKSGKNLNQCSRTTLEVIEIRKYN